MNTWSWVPEMELRKQSIEGVLECLSPLDVDWQDDVSRKVIAQLENFPIKQSYVVGDIMALLEEDFDSGSLIARLFLGLSKDDYQAKLKITFGRGKAGKTSFRMDPNAYAEGLVNLGLLQCIEAAINREQVWSDVLVERLRSGRGSAMSGQKRGRYVEDYVETILKRVFGNYYASRCNFTGKRNQTAKCDFAIPSKETPRIIIEVKGYGATGSKMTDVIGDVEKIIAAKRSDSVLIIFTDGIPWLERQSDLAKLVEYQNQGDVFHIYTLKMAEQFEADLETLKTEYGL